MFNQCSIFYNNCKREKRHYGLNRIKYSSHIHSLFSLSGAKLSVLIPLGELTKRPLLEKLMLSSVLFSSILSPTTHTGLQGTVSGWLLETVLYACVCVYVSVCVCNTCVLQLSQWVKLRICCRTSSVRRLLKAVWPTGRSRQWTLAPMSQSWR